MFKPNKLTWAKCPECKIELNDTSFYPIALLSSCYAIEIKCPGCKKAFYCESTITVKFASFKKDK